MGHMGINHQHHDSPYVAEIAAQKMQNYGLNFEQRSAQQRIKSRTYALLQRYECTEHWTGK
jgi:hypothetical protein